MRDFFTNGSVITIVLVSGLLFMAAIFFGKDDVQYQFSHIYLDSIGVTEVKTETNRCVVFNSTKINLEEAKQIFIEEYGEGELLISNHCLTNAFGKKIYEEFRIPN